MAKTEAKNDRSVDDKVLSYKEYRKALFQLHVELVKLQEWVVQTGSKVCIVFEGRDGAGKGGTIKAITERVSPRIFRVVALPAPSERETMNQFDPIRIDHTAACRGFVAFSAGRIAWL